MKCDMCPRPATNMDGWANAFCEGHRIVAEANRATHEGGIATAEEYRERVRPALVWFKENPR